MATITPAQMSYVLDEVTSAVFINAFAQLDNIMGVLYDMRASSSRRERSTSIGGLGQFSTKNPGVAAAEDSPQQQFQKTFDHTAFAKQVPVARELIDDEDWGWFEDLGTQMGMAANRTFETLAAGPFNDAFAGATYLAEDGLSICNNAHLNVDSGNSQDNSGTSALSAANVGTTLTSMRKFTDYEGEKINVSPDILLVPVDLEQTAWEIVRSSQKPASANNDANYLMNRFQLVSWNFLTDTNNWFMMDSRQMKMNLRWYMRSGLEIFGDGDLFKGTRRIGGYFRQSHGVVDWRFVYGHIVS